MSWKVYNYGRDRIGDKIGASALIDYQICEKGDNFILIDPTYDSHISFPVKHFFPQISNFVIETKHSDSILSSLTDKGFEKFEVGNIWISAPSLKMDTGFTPTMYIPKYVKDFVNGIAIHSSDGKESKKLLDFDLKIIDHCLIDPQYNVGRRHDPIQWDRLVNRIRNYLDQEKINGVILHVPQYEWTFQQVIGLISACDLFIGGDTGSTHTAGALKKNIVAIYGDDSHDVKAFHEQKEREGRSHEWCSDPLSDTYKKFILKDNKFNEDEVFEYVKIQISKILEYKGFIKATKQRVEL